MNSNQNTGMPPNDTSLQLTEDHSSTIFSNKYQSTYHSKRGAISESRYVFIRHGLDYIYQKHMPKALSVLEVGFGTGLNAFLTYQYAQQKHIPIYYETIEPFPLTSTLIQQLNYTANDSEDDQFVFKYLHECQWDRDVAISDVFRLQKRLTLLENFTTQQTFDLIYFDAFAPAQQPELWTKPIFRMLFNLLKEGGVLVTYCAQGQMKRTLKDIGFMVNALPGANGKREMTRATK